MVFGYESRCNEPEKTPDLFFKDLGYAYQLSLIPVIAIHSWSPENTRHLSLLKDHLKKLGSGAGINGLSMLSDDNCED